jgi:hypothetical protein
VDRASTYSTLTQAYAMLNLVGPANRRNQSFYLHTYWGTKASIYILIGDGIHRTLLLGDLRVWRMNPSEVILHSALLTLSLIWWGKNNGREGELKMGPGFLCLVGAE